MIGLPSLCAPPRFFNQMAMKVLNDITKITGIELLRHLAMLNIGMADAAIASWESKYFYSMWRPCTGIPNADLDGNDLTVADKNYTPYGAPSSNEPGHKNFNPPFPSYPSG